MQSLYTAATGMLAQQMNIDVISNNLANVNTNGFKKQRVDFQDLLYLNVKPAGAPATRDTTVPVGNELVALLALKACRAVLTVRTSILHALD